MDFQAQMWTVLDTVQGVPFFFHHFAHNTPSHFSGYKRVMYLVVHRRVTPKQNWKTDSIWRINKKSEERCLGSSLCLSVRAKSLNVLNLLLLLLLLLLRGKPSKESVNCRGICPFSQRLSGETANSQVSIQKIFCLRGFGETSVHLFVCFYVNVAGRELQASVLQTAH